MGRARDNKLARHDKAVMLRLHRRQDSGTCPAIAPQDCQPLADCCPLSSECIALADGGTGCVVSNNQGQTLTLTPQPKVSPTSAPASTTTSDTTSTPSTITTVPITTTSSTPPAPLPTTTSSPSTIASTDSSTFISSLPTTSITTENPTSSITSLPSIPTSPSGFTTTSTSSTTTPGVIGGQSPPAPGNDAKEANLNKNQITALVVAPLSAIILAVVAYLIWRRRRAKNQTPTTAAASRGNYAGNNDNDDDDDDDDDDRRPMATTLLDRRIGSTRSTGTQNSMATTDILLRASEDGAGPLRSHPISLAPMMLGAIPQSPLSNTNHTEKSDDSSFKSAAAKNESEGSSGSSPILAPFGQEYIHGHIRYSSAPMRYVTRLDADGGAPTEAEGEAADLEGSQTSPRNSQARHMSWMMNPFGRSSSTIPSTSRTVTPGDWITTSSARAPEDQRVSSLRSDIDLGEWKGGQNDEKDSPRG